MWGKFLLNYPKRTRISCCVLDFFINEMNYARDAEHYKLWLVSPWITESDFQLSDRGFFQNIWPGFNRSSISLRQILEKFLEYGTELKIVCYPPHQLISGKELLDYYEYNQLIKEIGEFSDELAKRIPEIITLTQKQAQIQNHVMRLVSDQRKGLGDLSLVFDKLRLRIKSHSNMIHFLSDLKRLNPENVNICYNYRLHAKILLGKFGGFFGSANITHSGLNFNDELWMYTSDKKMIAELGKVCERLSDERSKWWVKTFKKYNSFWEYAKWISDEDKLREMISDPALPDDIVEIIQLIGLKM